MRAPCPNDNRRDGRAERRDRTDRIAAILEAACRVIARDGAHGLHMQAVADEAGVSKALVHYYFATRQELLRRAFASRRAGPRRRRRGAARRARHGAGAPRASAAAPPRGVHRCAGRSRPVERGVVERHVRSCPPAADARLVRDVVRSPRRRWSTRGCATARFALWRTRRRSPGASARSRTAWSRSSTSRWSTRRSGRDACSTPSPASCPRRVTSLAASGIARSPSGGLRARRRSRYRPRRKRPRRPPASARATLPPEDAATTGVPWTSSARVPSFGSCALSSPPPGIRTWSSVAAPTKIACSTMPGRRFSPCRALRLDDDALGADHRP